MPCSRQSCNSLGRSAHSRRMTVISATRNSSVSQQFRVPLRMFTLIHFTANDGHPELGAHP